MAQDALQRRIGWALVATASHGTTQVERYIYEEEANRVEGDQLDEPGRQRERGSHSWMKKNRWARSITAGGRINTSTRDKCDREQNLRSAAQYNRRARTRTA
jgi:hypothetical protein